MPIAFIPHDLFGYADRPQPLEFRWEEITNSVAILWNSIALALYFCGGFLLAIIPAVAGSGAKLGWTRVLKAHPRGNPHAILQGRFDVYLRRPEGKPGALSASTLGGTMHNDNDGTKLTDSASTDCFTHMPDRRLFLKTAALGTRRSPRMRLRASQERPKRWSLLCTRP